MVNIFIFGTSLALLSLEFYSHDWQAPFKGELSSSARTI